MKIPQILTLIRHNDCRHTDKKKAIYPRQPIFFVNLKSNTMKNTLQRYGLSAYLQIFKAK